MKSLRTFATRVAAPAALVLACAAALPAFQAAPAPAKQETCSLEGRVLNAANGEPAGKVSLVLSRTDAPKTGAALPSMFSTTSDAAGRFAMKGLEPGRYRLMATRNGFVKAEYGARKLTGSGAVLTLSPEHPLKDLVFRLTPHGVVTGRVIDEDGEPVASATVQLLKMQYSGGTKQLGTAGSATTNDLGEYRIAGASPGRYFVCAIIQISVDSLALDRSATSAPPENYVPTYYPGAVDAAAATTVDVTAGEVNRGINVAIAKMRAYSIRGRVSPPGGQILILAPRSLSGALSLRMVRPDPKGDFEVKGVPPGKFALTGSARVNGKNYSASLPIDVAAADIDGLTLAIGAGFPVTGRLRVDGETKEDLSNVQVRMQAREVGVGALLGALGSVLAGSMPLESSGKLDKDLTFRLEDLSEDSYEVRVNGLPDGFYVKSIRSGEVDVLRSGLKVKGGSPEPLEILVSPHAGQIAGLARTADQQPAVEAVVALVPQDADRRGSPVFYRDVKTDAAGQFTLKGLPPGSYKIFAWEDVESGAWLDNEFIKPLEVKGDAVTVRESGTENVQVKVI